MELEKTTNSVRATEPELKKKKARKYKYNHWALTLMVLPALIHVFIFSYMPMGGLIMAFKKYNFRLGLLKSPFNGVENFKFLVQSNTFFQLVRNTIGYNVLFIICGILFAVTVAVLLDNINKKIFVKLYQGTLFLPYFLSWIIVSYVTHALLHPQYGIINSLIASMGGDKISFYTEPKYWPFIFVIASIWKTVGNNSLIYYGTIIGISPELYESASLDGCGWFQKLWYITLPHLKSTIIILFIMSIGSIFRSDYGMFMFLSKESGALSSVTETMDTFIFRSITNASNLGMPSAAGFLQSVVGFITVMAANAIVKKIEPENALF